MAGVFARDMIAAMAKKKQAATNEAIFELLLEMDERMATKDDLKKLGGRVGSIEENMVTKADLKDYATKNDLERMKGEIVDVIEPVVKAFDKDAVTLVDHGKRIVVLERKAGIAVK